MRLTGVVGLAVLAQILTTQEAFAEDSATSYRVARRIAGPDGRWDLAVVDPRTRRLYVGKEGGILAIGLADEKVLPTIFASPVVHQILPLEDGRLIVTTGPGNNAVVLDEATGQVISIIPTGTDPDGAAYDRKTGRAMTFNRGSLDATIFNVAPTKPVVRLKLPGKPESAVADGDGTVYVNIESSNEIAAIDVRKARITDRFALHGCEEPTGLALDATSDLLIAACTNGIAKVLTTRGRAIVDLAVGPEPDAVFIDSGRKLAFVPAGGDGTLSIISFADRNNIRVVQRIATQLGVRTGAVDSQTGTVYLPAATLRPPTPPAQWPSVVPGTFEIIVIERSDTRPRGGE